MKIITTKKGDEILVCDADYELLKHRTWHLGPIYPRTTYYCTPRKFKNIYMHQLIMPRVKGMVIDHINRNKLDNRRCNLRLVSRSQNCLNVSRKKGVSSKYTGVRKVRKKWQARITVNGKETYLGTFETDYLAAKAYDKKCLEIRGRFAVLNFPENT